MLPRIRTKKPGTPPLEGGERMTQAEFHDRYNAYPEDVKIELIGGVVNMASPMRDEHGGYCSAMTGAFFLYVASTPGTRATERNTVILGDKSEPQPDVILRLLPEVGGLARVNEKGYLTGPPEMIVEVSHSTLSLDLNAKRQDYLDAGVQEYLVINVEGQELHWFHFPSKRQLKPTKAGIWKSLVFPGLWIDGPALLAVNEEKLVAAVQQGLASPKHAEFIQTLNARRKRSK